MLTIPLLKIKQASTEYVRFPYTVNVDPSTVGDISIAFVAGHSSQLPDSPNWHVTEKQDDHARILVGPGTTVGQLDKGVYNVFVKVDATPETPVERVGMLYVA